MRSEAKFRLVCTVYAVVFVISSFLELKNSVPDAFVLFTVSLCFALALRRGKIYAVAASILGLTFAAVSLMAVFSSIMLVILNAHTLNFSQVAGIFESQLGVLGFTAAPFLVSLLKNWSEPKRG